MVSYGMWLPYNHFLPPTSYNIIVISWYTSHYIHPLSINCNKCKEFYFMFIYSLSKAFPFFI